MNNFIKFLDHNYFLFFIVIGIFIYLQMTQVRAIFRLHKCYHVLNFLPIIGMFYPTTKIAQFFLIGPAWYRSYFADIGFVPFLAFFLIIVKNVIIEADFLKAKIIIWVIAIIAMISEFSQIWFLKTGHTNLGAVKGFTARGDIIDLWIFYIMLILCLMIINKSEKRTRQAMISCYDSLSHIKKKKFRNEKQKVLENLKIQF